MLLRLPLHAEMTAFPRVTDVPLIAPRFPCSRDEARRRLDLPASGPLVVLSFSGPGLEGFDAARLRDLPGIAFVTTEALPKPPPNVLVRTPGGLDYPMLLAAADAVVTKPGYGIVATCLRNGLRALCARRDDFPEAPVLEEALACHGTAAMIDPRDLLECRFGPALEALLSRPVAPVSWPGDGARRAAEIVLREAAA
jgi:L-arabinokinase